MADPVEHEGDATAHETRDHWSSSRNLSGDGFEASKPLRQRASPPTFLHGKGRRRCQEVLHILKRACNFFDNPFFIIS